MLPSSPSLVLASSSPKRKEILNALGLKFKTHAPAVEEITSAPTPQRLVSENARLKAKAISHVHPHSYIIGADTVVTAGKNVFLKPSHWQEGMAMLRTYRHGPNYVYTGLAIYEPEKKTILTRTQRSKFKLAPLTYERQEKIFRLIYSTEQSGGFSIEGLGSILLHEITGSYYNILGLPVYLLDKMFLELGCDLLTFQKKESKKH